MNIETVVVGFARDQVLINIRYGAMLVSLLISRPFVNNMNVEYQQPN